MFCGTMLAVTQQACWTFIAVLLLFSPGTGLAQSLKKVNAAFNAFAYANPPFWIAKDLKLFEKYGLDVDLVYVGGSRPVQAMLGGSIDVSQAGGAATVAAAAKGAEVAILGTVFDRLVFAVHAVPQIKDINDLKGKTIATGNVGGNNYFAARLLLSKLGWVLNRDIFLRITGGTPEALAALQHGQVQAAIMTPPTTTLAIRSGFRQIFDIASLELPFPSISVVSSRRFVKSNPETILNVLRATSEAIHLYQSQPEQTLPVVAKYMRVPKDDPSLRESYELLGRHLNKTLDPSLEGIKFILDFLAEQEPSVKSKKAEEFVDTRYLQKLREEGFFNKLSGK